MDDFFLKGGEKRLKVINGRSFPYRSEKNFDPAEI